MLGHEPGRIKRCLRQAGGPVVHGAHLNLAGYLPERMRCVAKHLIGIDVAQTVARNGVFANFSQTAFAVLLDEFSAELLGVPTSNRIGIQQPLHTRAERLSRCRKCGTL